MSSILRPMIISARRRTPRTRAALPSFHGSAARSVPAARSGPSIGTPWFARLVARLSAGLRDRRTPDLLDVLIAAGCFAAFSGPVLPALLAGQDRARPSALFSVLAAAPLIVRRRWPITTLAILVGVYACSTLLGVQFTPFVSSAGPNLAIAIFTVADRYDRRTSLLAYGLAAVCTWAVLGVGIYLHPGLDQDAVQAGVMIPGWFIGDTVRTRRLYRQSLARESDRQASETEARIRAEERLRLSRDVHDIVSHSLSMIAVRSGVARLVLDDKPGEARAALTAIETASRSALDEVRLLLRQIRDPSQAAGSQLADQRRHRRTGAAISGEWPRPDLHCSGQTGQLWRLGRDVGLSDRAGGADQRDPARPGCPRHAPDRARHECSSRSS